MRPALPAALFAALCLLSAATACAAAPPSPPEDDVSPVFTPGWDAATHHAYARRTLLRGRAFARGALHLEEAARRDPKDPEHRLLLGCAHASRAASLAYARGWNRMRLQAIKEYPERLREWEGQKKEAEARGEVAWFHPDEPRPEPYPTKDDGKPYKLTDAEFRAEWDRRHADALAAWEQAARLSTTPAQRARVEHVRGWGLWILHTYSGVAEMGADEAEEAEPTEPATDGDEEEEKPEEDPKARAKRESAEKAILVAFEKAVELAPGNAVYWESLGEFLRLGAEMRQPPVVPPRPDGKPRPTAREAHLAALRLNPKNAPLWHLLGLEEKPTSSDATDAKSVEKRKRALEFFEKAAAADPANPAPLHLIASLHFDPTPFQNLSLGARAVEGAPELAPEKMIAKGRLPENREAARLGLDALVRANLRPSPRSLRYRPPVPEELSAAWDYTGAMAHIEFRDSAALRALARNAAGYARFLAEEGGDPAQARRAADAVLTLGARLMGDWPVRDRERHDGSAITVLVGQAVADVGHFNKVRVLRRLGDEAGAAAAEAERAAFQERKREWTLAFRDTMRTSLADDY